MLRLCLRTLLLIIVLSVTIFTARLIGKMRPAPSLFAVIFTNPDGSPCEMPCMFGVRPGKMTGEQAINILKTHPATHDFRQVNYEQNGYVVFDNEKFNILVGLKSEIIITSFLCSNSQGGENTLKSGTLGDIIEAWGNPDRIIVANRGVSGQPRMSFIFWRYGIIDMEAQYQIAPPDLIDTNARLCTISIPSMNSCGNDNKRCSSWRGFGSANRYLPKPNS